MSPNSLLFFCVVSLLSLKNTHDILTTSFLIYFKTSKSMSISIFWRHNKKTSKTQKILGTKKHVGDVYNVYSNICMHIRNDVTTSKPFIQVL